MASREIVARLDKVCVEIPLRGLRGAPPVGDPRIVSDKKGRPFLRALSEVSLELRRGDRIGVIGGNGNGKTTLLKLIGGLLPAASGKIEVYGEVRPLLTLGAGNSMALTGRQNIALNHALLGIRSLTLKEYADNVTGFADLGVFIDMPLSTYSPGMWARLQFAMNTVEPADILLLDEWLGVADEAFQEKAHRRLVEFIEKNDVFLFASHNHELVAQMTDKRFRLELGRVIEEY
ncbi:MAG: ATP-binding cassette domain-containing protein [Candidatus Accumulibacter sp.]|jgi:ABC-type polysaccharide/polyol phosphate transport system ATPase subunit|nr:ATP-binding cassette domain-containing protein [Accumulibacter sp.]